MALHHLWFLYPDNQNVFRCIYTFDGSVKLGYTYQYDAMDRITEVRKSSSPNSKYLEYEYDALGQLVSATDHAAGLEYTYSFDTAGNILSAVKHPTGGGSDSTQTYHYDNASWRDLLTSITIDGTTKELKYPKDSSGNVSSGTPLSWYNGNEYTLDWTNGTQLKSAKKGLALKTSYTYDMAGVRSGKTVGTTKYEFTTLSGLVMRQAWGARQMDFVYDENNQPYALIYKSGKNVTPVMYYYLLNQQGDVEALMDASGAIVATYEYDPWGAVTVKNASGALDNDDTSIGNLNPLRYRGYYYDNETGFYYLQSRYYDPVVGRFISEDIFASTGQGMLGCNMFAYCGNNPSCWSDPTGEYRFIEDFNISDVQKTDNKIKTTGGSISGGWGLYGQMSITVVKIDGIPSYSIVTVGVGGGLGFDFNGLPSFKSASFSLDSTLPNISILDDFRGWGVDIGGTLGFITCDVANNAETSYQYSSVGLGPIGVDFHALVTYTWVVPIEPYEYSIGDIHAMH